MIFTSGCSDSLKLNNKEEKALSSEAHSSLRSNITSNGTIKYFNLGQKREIPFKPSIVEQAYCNLYHTTTTIAPTHRYVKFELNDKEDLLTLYEWMLNTETPFFDYPLEYDVSTSGEMNIPASFNGNSAIDPILRDRYASVPISLPLPNINHIKIADLYIDFSDPLLIAEAFRITNNTDEINGYVLKGGLSYEELLDIYADNPTIMGDIGLPNIDCAYGCYPKLIIDTQNPLEYRWVCHCPPPDNGPYNACGCEIFDNPRYPAGCIRVEQDGTNKGVQNIMVITKNTWFNGDLTLTDDLGCWEINDEYRGWMKYGVVFINENVRVRDTRYWLGIPILWDYVGKDDAPPYNNQELVYEAHKGQDDLEDRRARMYWAACHSLNLVSEFRENALSDGIPLPREGLNWYNKRGDGAAAAPMLQGHVFNSWPAYLTIILFPRLYPMSLLYLPDIYLRYGINDEAEEFRGTGFHELGHASHYENVGEAYWRKYRNHIINNGGYGSYGNFDNNSHKGHVALGEAIGNYYENRYGNTPFGGELYSFYNNFIPIGLFYDLEDDEVDYIEDPNNSSISSYDNILGFTPAMFMDAAHDDINSIREFRDELRALHLNDTPNKATEYNSLVDVYDVFH